MVFASDNGVKSTQVFWPRDIQGFEKSPFSTQPKGKSTLPKGRFAPPVLGRAVWSIFSFACNTLYLPQGRPSGPQMWPLGSEESGRDSTTELLVLTPMSQPPGGGSYPRRPWKDPSEGLSHSRTCFLWPLTWEKAPTEKEFFNLNSGLAVLRLTVEITQKTNIFLENAFCFFKNTKAYITTYVVNFQNQDQEA